MGAYSKPPQIIDDNMAIAIGATNQVLLAASAIAIYRVYAISVGVNRNATGFTDIFVRFGSTEFFTTGGLIQGKAHAHAEYEFPGVQVGPNASLQWQTNGTAAAGSAFIYVWYYSDPYVP